MNKKQNKPQMKREVTVTIALDLVRTIYFYGTPDSAIQFGDFGEVVRGRRRNLYELTVDARFDFDEVLAYINGYG